MHDFVAYVMLMGTLSDTGELSFWAVTNQFGFMPERSGALALAGAGTSFDDT